MSNPEGPLVGDLTDPRVGDLTGRAIIVRYGEISLKGRNRGCFEQKLREDLAWFLRAHQHPFAAIEIERGRIYIRDCQGLPDLKMVLGVYSYSPALEIDRDYEKLKEAVAFFFPAIRNSRDFRVSCQRMAKDFCPDSMGVEREWER